MKDEEGLDWQNLYKQALEILELTHWSGNLSSAYEALADKVIGMVPCETIHLRFLSVDKASFSNSIFRHKPGFEQPNSAAYSSNAITNTLRWVIENKKPTVISRRRALKGGKVPSVVQDVGFRIVVCTPLQTQDSVFGMCSFVYYGQDVVSQDAIDYYFELGRIIGLAINQIQTTQNIAEVAVLEEQRRLSKEINNNIAQEINTLLLYSEMALSSLSEHDEARTQADLEHLGQVGRKTMAHLKNEVLTLSYTQDRIGTFVQMVKDILASFEDEWGIKTVFVEQVEDGQRVLSSTMITQLARIIYECLLNAARHANAGEVSVEIISQGEYLSFSVIDNGCGFDQAQVPQYKYGLKVMRERASTIGARLSITSGPGGTSVFVDLGYK